MHTHLNIQELIVKKKIKSKLTTWRVKNGPGVMGLPQTLAVAFQFVRVSVYGNSRKKKGHVVVPDASGK